MGSRGQMIGFLVSLGDLCSASGAFTSVHPYSKMGILTGLGDGRERDLVVKPRLG